MTPTLHWVSRFGVPKEIVSDQGSQFTSGLFSSLNQLVGSQLKLVTAYHPQANGMIERIHRSLKNALIAKAGEWMQSLPWVLLGLRAAPRSDDDASPAERVYGWPLTLPGSLLDAAELSAESLSTSISQLKSGFPVRPQVADPLA